jgi:hypothetical protein
MQIKTISDFRAAIRQGPYAWPGGYPLYFVTSDGAALSFKAARKERRNILESIANRSNDGWRVIGLDVNWEDSQLYCDHTNEKIESAYGDDDGVLEQAAWYDTSLKMFDDILEAKYAQWENVFASRGL